MGRHLKALLNTAPWVGLWRTALGDLHDIGRYALSALWVFGLLGAFLWWLNKKRGLPFAKHLDKRIQILEVYPMGLKNKMMLVQVDDQRMLLSMNTQDIRTLHAWTCTSREVQDATSQEQDMAPANSNAKAPITSWSPGHESPPSQHLESTS